MSKPAATTKNTNFIELKSDEQFRNILKEHKFIAIDFTATWCGPCKAIGPVFQKLSESHPSVIFLKVDVDEFNKIAQEYKVTAMPTFLFLEVGKEPETLVGANKAQLESQLVALSKKATAAAAAAEKPAAAAAGSDSAAAEKPAATADKPDAAK
ncbi:glycerol ether metabolic process [Coemansia guatemalensis]|uniref:Glycerol ether metabolic process n=1 Tax=Coemansia guatemalensis TaxID=2761395 RepID=A0A9W8LR36_9FUNG|nr:glycerol ether metabolic process [Coemansia guatemalensis]